MAVIGYARVSSKGQAKDGNSLEKQKEELTAAGAEQIFVDVFTGTKMNRPEFEKALEILKPGDTLIVTKLDRFARSVGQASDLITKLLDQGVTVNVLNLGILSNDSVNTLLRNVLLSFAQFERDMIVQRTQEGKEIARQRPDYREGRPKKFGEERIMLALELKSAMSYKEVENRTGISKSTLIRAKREGEMEKSMKEYDENGSFAEDYMPYLDSLLKISKDDLCKLLAEKITDIQSLIDGFFAVRLSLLKEIDESGYFNADSVLDLLNKVIDPSTPDCTINTFIRSDAFSVGEKVIECVLKDMGIMTYDDTYMTAKNTIRYTCEEFWERYGLASGLISDAYLHGDISSFLWLGEPYKNEYRLKYEREKNKHTAARKFETFLSLSKIIQ